MQENKAHIMRDSFMVNRTSLNLNSTRTSLLQNNVMLMEGTAATADIVSPYALRNLTDVDINVRTVEI